MCISRGRHVTISQFIRPFVSLFQASLRIILLPCVICVNFFQLCYLCFPSHLSRCFFFSIYIFFQWSWFMWSCGPFLYSYIVYWPTNLLCSSVIFFTSNFVLISSWKILILLCFFSFIILSINVLPSITVVLNDYLWLEYLLMSLLLLILIILPSSSPLKALQVYLL